MIEFPETLDRTARRLFAAALWLGVSPVLEILFALLICCLFFGLGQGVDLWERFCRRLLLVWLRGLIVRDDLVVQLLKGYSLLLHFCCKLVAGFDVLFERAKDVLCIHGGGL